MKIGVSRSVLRQLVLPVAGVLVLCGNVLAGQQEDTSTALVRERFVRLQRALNQYAGEFGHFPQALTLVEKFLADEQGRVDASVVRDPFSNDRTLLNYECSGSSYTLRCGSPLANAPVAVESLRRRPAPPVREESLSRYPAQYKRGLLSYDRFVTGSIDCSKGESGTECVKALAEEYKVSEGVSWGEEDILAVDRARCEQIIRTAFALNGGHVYRTPEAVEADCVILRLALSCDPDDIVLLLRLGSEAPADWCQRILRDALDEGVMKHARGGLPASAWKQICSELGHALRMLDETERQKEVQQHTTRGPFEMKYHLGSLMRGVLGDLMAEGQISRDDLRAIGQKEQRDAVSSDARAAMNRFVDDVDSLRLHQPPDGELNRVKAETRQKRLTDSTIRTAFGRLNRVRMAIDGYAMDKGVFPQSLDEIASRVAPDDLIDPLPFWGKRFLYESDGSFYTLKSAKADESGVADDLTAHPRFVLGRGVSGGAGQESSLASPSPTPSLPLSRAEEKAVDESLNRMNLIRMILWSYRTQKGGFPSALEEVFPPDNKYLRRIGDPMLVPIAQASMKADHRVAPPSGYQWYYKRSHDGRDFLLGLQREGSVGPDVEKQPVISTQEPQGQSARMPGTPQARSAVEGFQE